MFLRFLSPIPSVEAQSLEREIDQKLSQETLEGEEIERTCFALSKFDPSFTLSPRCQLDDFREYLEEAKSELHWIGLGIDPKQIGDKGLNIEDALILYRDTYEIIESDNEKLIVKWNLNQAGLGIYKGEATRSENGLLKTWKVLERLND